VLLQERSFTKLASGKCSCNNQISPNLFDLFVRDMSLLCRDVAVCSEVSATVCSDRTFSSSLTTKLSEPDLPYSLAPHTPYLSKHEIYDIRI